MVSLFLIFNFMGLFDSIIGSANEEAEPLDM